MGTGIWSMHFIGMLAFHLPIPVAYDLPVTLLSMIIAIVVSAIALFVLRRPQLGIGHLGVGAILMGIGISAMHYTGMFAMQMSPPIRYDPPLFAASILIAMVASLAALWIAFQLRRKNFRHAILAKLGSAGVMGLAITGMHYTGMAAAQFAPDSVCLAASSGGINSAVLGIAIGGITVAIMSLTLIVSALDADFATNNARLAHSLQLAKEAAEAALRDNEKITRELRDAQSELVITARLAGMAEIATNVLHNVGNVLNSVNVSAGLVRSTMRDSKARGLAKAVRLMNDHAGDLGDFLTRDEKGKRLPDYLNKAVAALAAEQQGIVEELESLAKSIDHIKKIIATQQAHAGTRQLVELVQVRDLLEDALRLHAGALTRHGVTVVKELAEVPPLRLDPHRLLQILVNLISNAKQAMAHMNDPPHRMTLGVAIAEGDDGRRLRIRVADEGDGIPSENMAQLFVHGFTTRKNGSGFGLHSCALAAKAMGGTLLAHSDGPGKGATFTLELPIEPVGDTQ
jgi:NO-binding membrane sensor protein with MHYT domain